MIQTNDYLLLAVSGGIDSVVLCHLCKQAGFRFAIAHCNFQLRGEESERDESFVRNLADTLNVPFFVRRFDTAHYAAEKRISIQVAARTLRYEWFFQVLEGHGEQVQNDQTAASRLNCLVTAHHLDDNIETVLMNFCKGTGITGVRGMLSKSRNIIRPLLFATKEEIRNYAKNSELIWIEDSSNDETKYTRNYFRKVVIPAVEKVYPDLQHNLKENIRRFGDVHQLYVQAIERHKQMLLEKKGKEVHVPVLKLLKSMPLSTIVYEIIKEFGFSSQQVKEVEKLLTSESGKYVVSATHRILRNRAWLIISPIAANEQEIIVVEKKDQEKIFADKCIKLNWVDKEEVRMTADNQMAFLDAAEVQFPLLIRKWRQGDYFYPLGMRKKKKLARFFIDRKMPLTDKEKVWVVESHKRILWVVGLRIDDRFKITDKTRQVLRLAITSL